MSTKGREIQLYQGYEDELPILKEGEPAYTYDRVDKNEKIWVGTKNGNKVLQGITPISDDLVSDKSDHALSAKQGRILNEKIEAIGSSSGQTNIIDRLDSDSPVSALSARQGKVLKEMIDNKTSVEIVNDLDTGGSDKALSAEQGKILDERKILEYGGFLEGTINFDNLTPNKIYKVRSVASNSVGAPTTDISANHGAYSELEFFDAGGYQVQRMTQVVGGKSMMFRSRDRDANNGAWGAWQRSRSINTYYPTNVIENLGATSASKSFGWFGFENNTTSEEIKLRFPKLNIWGMFKLSLASNSENSDASGGAEIIIHVGATGIDSNIYQKEMNIVSMTDEFANNFYISDLFIEEHRISLVIIKRKAANPLSVKLEYNSYTDNAWDIVNGIEVGRYTYPNVLTQPIQKSIFTRVDENKTLIDNLSESLKGQVFALTQVGGATGVINYSKIGNRVLVEWNISIPQPGVIGYLPVGFRPPNLYSFPSRESLNQKWEHITIVPSTGNITFYAAGQHSGTAIFAVM